MVRFQARLRIISGADNAPRPAATDRNPPSTITRCRRIEYIDEPQAMHRRAARYHPLPGHPRLPTGKLWSAAGRGRRTVGSGVTLCCIDRPPELQRDRHWRLAVWALRVGCVGLVTGIAGLVVMWSGSTPWVLAVGVVIWLAPACVTMTGFFWSRHDLPDPRPGYWAMRFMLIHDTVHLRPSNRSS